MERSQQFSSIGGLTIIFFIIAITISLAFYQFIFLKELNLKPSVPEEIANPPQPLTLTIAEGASLPTNPIFFDPSQARASLGVDNKLIWENHDATSHTITTDNDYEDPLSGKFDSMDTIGLVPPGGTYEFVFTEEGEYPYHCEPHPWMTGTVTIVENFS
jgi:plastocyanin